MRRVVSLYLPTWSTDRIRRKAGRPPEGKAAPLVTALPDHGRRVIAAVDGAARLLGVVPGMTVTRARGLVPELDVVDAAPEEDLEGLRRLALWAGRRYSPVVAPDPPDGIWIDITGCAHRFDGEMPMLKDMMRRIATSGMTCQAAVADTAGCAHAVARLVPSGRPSLIEPRGERAALSILPVGALRIEPGVAEELRRMGFERIEQLIAAPRGPLAKRFGRQLYKRLDQALGQVPEPIEPIFPPEIPRVRRGLLEPIGTAPALTQVITDLAVDITVLLTRTGTGARALDLYFQRVDGHSIVAFARSKGILCQGRGSAANSAVCFVLGITSIDPVKSELLFERFVSAERREPPDIDVDFEHERREEVIQWIYKTYGRERSALTAVVSRFRARGAVREVGKALGLTEDVVAGLAGQVWGWSREGVDERHAEELNLDTADRRLALTLELARLLINTPRHTSQHPGGFVLTLGRLDELVPIEPAAMANRQIIEWDKDDIDALGFMKVDVLGLGMLGCMRRAFALLEEDKGIAMDLAAIPHEDPATYAMIRKADTLGVFQIESRAQMAMLPRIKPKEFYDLVVQVAIVRPGPIQGDMVHPYLRRREGKEPVNHHSASRYQVGDISDKTTEI